MPSIDKSKLTETDIITKFILPAVKDAGWNDMTQIRQEVKLRDGKVVVRGKVAARKKVKSADIVLYHKPSMPLAVAIFAYKPYFNKVYKHKARLTPHKP